MARSLSARLGRSMTVSSESVFLYSIPLHRACGCSCPFSHTPDRPYLHSSHMIHMIYKLLGDTLLSASRLLFNVPQQD